MRNILTGRCRVATDGRIRAIIWSHAEFVDVVADKSLACTCVGESPRQIASKRITCTRCDDIHFLYCTHIHTNGFTLGALPTLTASHSTPASPTPDRPFPDPSSPLS